MDLSNLAPNFSNVLNADTLKLVGVLLGLWTAKVVVGKAWGAAKSVAAQTSFIGLVSSVFIMGGLGGVGFGVGQVKKPTEEPVIVAQMADKTADPMAVKLLMERRLNDFKRLPQAEYDAKWRSAGALPMEEVHVPVLGQSDSFVLGCTSIAAGAGALIVGIGAFMKKYG